MAVSGSTNFSLNRNVLIESSLRLIGALEAGENMTSEELNDSAQALNIMLKAWQPEGLDLWMRRSKSITLTASTNTYTLGPSGTVVMDRPIRILQVLRRDASNNDVELFKLSQQEYWNQTPKTSTGVPNSFWYDPQLTNGKLYIWPTPGTTEAANYTLEVLYLKPIDDLDAATDDFEVPQEWYEAVKYGLALRLAPEFGVGIQERRELRSEFREIFNRAKDSDQEDSSIYFMPDARRNT